MTQVITEPLSHQQGEHMRSAVERITAFAAAARPEHLTNHNQSHVVGTDCGEISMAERTFRRSGSPKQADRSRAATR